MALAAPLVTDAAVLTPDPTAATLVGGAPPRQSRLAADVKASHLA